MIKQYTIKSNTKDEKYSVTLTFYDGVIIPEKSSCTCIHGSWFRFTQENIKSGNWKCAHIIEAIKRYKNNIPDDIEIQGRIGNEKNNRKQICPIFQ